MRRIGVTMDVDGALYAADRRRVLDAALIGTADFIRLDVTGLCRRVLAHLSLTFFLTELKWIVARAFTCEKAGSQFNCWGDSDSVDQLIVID